MRMQRMGLLWALAMVVLGWKLGSAKGGEQGFMVFGTTLEAQTHKVTYEIIADEVAELKSKRKSFTEEDLQVDLLTTGDPIRDSLPPSHSLLSHRRTECQVRFTVRNLENNSHFWDDAYPPDALTPSLDMTNPGRYMYSYSTKDLLGQEAAKSASGTAVHSAFWLLDTIGIRCVRFDKMAKLVGGILTIKTWIVPLKVDSHSTSDHHIILRLIEGQMTKIKDQRAAEAIPRGPSPDGGEKDSVYTVFVTTLAAIDDVVYKIVGEDPVGKRSNRKSFTEDFLPFHLLTKQEGASLPRSHSLLSHQKTTIEAKFFVRKVAKPAEIPSQVSPVKATQNQISTLRQKSATKKLSAIQFPPLIQSLDPTFVTKSAENSSPPVLAPVPDTLDLDMRSLDFQYMRSSNFQTIEEYILSLNLSSMYSYSTFGLLPEYPPQLGKRPPVHSSLWLLDGEGIHCFRFNSNEKYMGEMLTMAKWQFPLPTSPQSPTDSKEILARLAQLMKKVREHRDQRDAEEGLLQKGLLTVKT